MNFELDGSKFYTSSISDRNDRCVAVSIQKNKVLLTNSKKRNIIVEFTHEEWISFIEGVKKKEFDINEE